VTPGNVVLSSVKKAEDDDALIFRLHETDGTAVTANVVVDPALLGRPSAAQEVDFLERPEAQSSAEITDGNGFQVRIGAYGIASVKVPLTQ